MLKYETIDYNFMNILSQVEANEQLQTDEKYQEEIALTKNDYKE